MLSRLYVDNYRCLVNFELNLGSLAVFVGPNGSGKSSVLDALTGLKRFVSGAASAVEAFPPGDLTRWQSRLDQTFELTIRLGDHAYQYRLVIEHDDDRRHARVKQEQLSLDDWPLFVFEHSKVKELMGALQAQLFHDDGGEGAAYLFDNTRSGIGTISPCPYYSKLAWFKDYLAKMLVVRLDPFSIQAESDRETDQPRSDMRDFVSWYRHVSLQQQSDVFELRSTLVEAIDGFDSFNLMQTGRDSQSLRAIFRTGNDKEGGGTAYSFDELSLGQKAIAVFYTVLHCVRKGALLLLDEPDNFVALPEIQPFILALRDRCVDGKLQSVIVSHHPEVINLLGAELGLWFERKDNAPVRVRKIDGQDKERGMPLSELVARGWLHE